MYNLFPVKWERFQFQISKLFGIVRVAIALTTATYSQLSRCWHLDKTDSS